MAKQRLFPEPPKPPDDDTRTAKARFSNLAGKVFSVPKAEIDEREKEWQRKRARKRA